MNKTSFLKILGAAPKNYRWSWGGVRKDGSIVLLVWGDESRKNLDTSVSYMVKARDDLTSQGAVERLEHLDAIRNGASVLLAIAIDASEGNHESIKEIRTDYLFRGGELEADENGYVWIKRGERVSMADARKEA